MIKSFKAFDRLLENKRIFEGADKLIKNINVLSGSEDLMQARKFVKEMTNMNPPNTKNLGELARFCIDNYKGFDNKEDAGPLKPQVDNIKNAIKYFFYGDKEQKYVGTELEWSDQDYGFDTGKEAAVDAIFRNIRFPKVKSKGLLQRFFEIFEHVSITAENGVEGLDATAISMIKGTIQEIKEIWDPPGMDAYFWPFGGDSKPIKTFNDLFINVYGDYAEALFNLTETGKAQPQPAAQPAASATAQPAARQRASSGKSTSGQTWNRAKKIKI